MGIRLFPMPFMYIIFIGHHKERLLDSIEHWKRFYFPEKLLFVYASQEFSGARRAHEVAREMQRDLQSKITEVSQLQVDALHPNIAVRQIAIHVRREQHQWQEQAPQQTPNDPLQEVPPYEVVVMISGSLRIFSVVGYMLAQHLSSQLAILTHLVSAIPRFNDQDEEVGIERHIEIPIAPLIRLTHAEKKVIEIIGTKTITLETLAQRYGKSRNAIYRFINTLKDRGFLDRVPFQPVQTQDVWLTELGRLFLTKK